MRITGNVKIPIAAIAALFVGAVHVARAQAPIPPLASGGTTDAPFVDITIDGTEFVSGPGSLYYRVSADPGTFVTVFRISPSGRVSILRGYDQAIRGTKRTAIVRGTSTEYDDGIGYLVAVATRDKGESRNLQHQSIARFGLAERFFSADGALNDLLENVLARSGKHFAAAFVSYRSSTYRYSSSFADVADCRGAVSLGLLPANFAYYDIFEFEQTRNVHRSSLHSSYLSNCSGQQIPLILVLGPMKPVPPRLPGDTASLDSVSKLSPPRGPKTEPPVGYPALEREDGGTAAEFFTRATLPLIRAEPRTAPLESRIPLSQIHSPTPLATPMPVMPEIPVAPLTLPMVETERRDPVTPPIVEAERRDPAMSVPTSPPVSPMQAVGHESSEQPVRQERSEQPVRQERSEPTMQTPPSRELAPQPPPPPPPPPRTETKTLDPGAIPPP